MQPDVVKEFITEYHRELNWATAECAAAHELRLEELARVERQIRANLSGRSRRARGRPP